MQILVQRIICILYLNQNYTSKSFLSLIFATVKIKTHYKDYDYK